MKNRTLSSKKKTLDFDKIEIIIRSLTLDELTIVLGKIKNGPLHGAKQALEYGIVSPPSIKNNPGRLNAEIALVVATEILTLSGLYEKPPYNPSER